MPKFFKEIDHPFIKKPCEFIQNCDKPFCYELIKGQNGYWERRERQDWKDLPNIFGPFDE